MGNRNSHSGWKRRFGNVRPRKNTYVYEANLHFDSVHALTGDDLKQLKAFVVEIENCAIQMWLGQFDARRKLRGQCEVDQILPVLPYFGEPIQIRPAWRFERLRDWRLIRLVLTNRAARAWYARVIQRAKAIRAIRRSRLKRQSRGGPRIRDTTCESQ